MKILVFDNYDSFTYNLVQMTEQLTNAKIDVFRNDCIALENISVYDKIILSPGPGVPSEAGILSQVIREYGPSKSIFGVCLGQQAIAEVFGGRLINLKEIYHGVATTAIRTEPDAKILRGLPTRLEVGRYHSWAVDPETFPQDLTVTSVDEKGMIMSLQHKNFDVHGVQYHPESILTPMGRQILKNFLDS